MFFYGVRFIGRTILVLHRCSELFEFPFIGRTVIVLRRCSELFVFPVSRAYCYCTTPLARLNFLLFMTFSTTFNYGNAFGISIFILEPGVIVEIENAKYKMILNYMIGYHW